MLRNAAILLCLFISSSAFASGKLVLQPEYDTDLKTVYPTVGLSVYEKLADSWFYINSWTGFGQTEFQYVEKTTWITAKNLIELPMFKHAVVVGVGFENSYIPTHAVWHHSIVGKLAVKLW
jgi:hypothetical protein